MGRIVYITRKVSFCAAHRLHSLQLSDEENKRIYGKCNHVNGHGHNYKIKVTICGEVDETGMVMNLTDLKAVMEEVIMKQMDHKNLDKDVSFFETNPSTAENIAIYVWDEISDRLSTGNLFEVKVVETDNNTALYRGERS